MLQGPVLNHNISYGKSFLTTDYSTIHSFSEVVLHDNVIIVSVWSPFKRTHQVYEDSLIESPVGGLL